MGMLLEEHVVQGVASAGVASLRKHSECYFERGPLTNCAGLCFESMGKDDIMQTIQNYIHVLIWFSGSRLDAF